MSVFEVGLKLDDFARVFTRHVAVDDGFHNAFIGFVGVGELVMVIFQVGCFGAVCRIIWLRNLVKVFAYYSVEGFI